LAGRDTRPKEKVTLFCAGSGEKWLRKPTKRKIFKESKSFQPSLVRRELNREGEGFEAGGGE